MSALSLDVLDGGLAANGSRASTTSEVAKSLGRSDARRNPWEVVGVSRCPLEPTIKPPEVTGALDDGEAQCGPEVCPT